MNQFLLGLCTGILVIAFSGSAENKETPCAYFDTLTIRQCNNTTLLSCDTSECRIAKHLTRYVSYVRSKATSCSVSVSLMTKRYTSLADKQTYRIDHSMIQWLGDRSAPVSMILYISMSCPHCKQVYKQIYDTLHTDKSLQRKVRVGIKYRAKTRFDNLLLATTHFKKQPAFLRRCADISGRIDDKAVKKIAQMIDIPYDSLVAVSYTPEIIAAVKLSRQEGIDNGVRFTPAIFINDRKYYSTKSTKWIMDAVEFFAAEKKKTK